MSNGNDIDGFVGDPSKLAKLCRDVIDQLDATSEDAAVADQKAQLRVIAKAIEQLENSGVAVPDSLRAEKTCLVVALAKHADAKQALAQLADEFQDILKDLRERLGQNRLSGRRGRPQHTPAAAGPPMTSRAVLREHILQALRNLGGRARVPDVIEEMTRQLEGRLLPGDMEWREAVNKPVWIHNAHWERKRMKDDGVLRGDSPHGIWELAEDGE